MIENSTRKMGLNSMGLTKSILHKSLIKIEKFKIKLDSTYQIGVKKFKTIRYSEERCF